MKTEYLDNKVNTMAADALAPYVFVGLYCFPSGRITTICASCVLANDMKWKYCYHVSKQIQHSFG